MVDEQRINGKIGELPRWPLEKWLLLGTFVVSVLGFTFGVGVNWARVTMTDARQVAFEDAVPKTYLRADVYVADQRRLTESLDRLTRALEQMDARQAAASRTGRILDR